MAPVTVCLSVKFRYRDHTGWNTSKIIYRSIINALCTRSIAVNGHCNCHQWKPNDGSWMRSVWNTVDSLNDGLKKLWQFYTN